MSLKNDADSGERDDGLVRREFGIKIRAVRKDKREVDFVASTDCIDSYDEVVEQKWILERFHGNPVILFAHKSRELPIGRATRCEVVEGALECTIRFASAEANPLAEQILKLVDEECLNAVSVGFYPRSVRWEKRDDRDVYVLSDNELHEISVVPVPANPEALAKMKAKALAIAKAAATSSAEAQKEESAMAMTNEEKTTFDKAVSDARAAESKASELEKSFAKATVERDEALVRATTAEEAKIAMEVDALVGVKIAKAERDDFIEMAKTNRPLYERQVKNRPATGPLAKLGEQSVLKAEEKPLENKAAVDASGDEGDAGLLGA